MLKIHPINPNPSLILRAWIGLLIWKGIGRKLKFFSLPRVPIVLFILLCLWRNPCWSWGMGPTPWFCTSSNYILPGNPLAWSISFRSEVGPPGSGLHSLLPCFGHGDASHGPSQGMFSDRIWGIAIKSFYCGHLVQSSWYSLLGGSCPMCQRWLHKKYWTIFWFIIYNLIAM